MRRRARGPARNQLQAIDDDKAFDLYATTEVVKQPETVISAFFDEADYFDALFSLDAFNALFSRIVAGLDDRYDVTELLPTRDWRDTVELLPPQRIDTPFHPDEFYSYEVPVDTRPHWQRLNAGRKHWMKQ